MKTARVLLPAFIVLVLIGLIPFVRNDYVLSGLYLLLILLSGRFIYRRRDELVFAAGFFLMLCSEYLFIRTGVETFQRTSLFGLMPLWLPLLWGYGFIAMRRFIELVTA